MRLRTVYLLFFLLIPSLAYPHVRMLECDPNEDAVVEESPEKVSITFLGSVEPVFSKIEVFDEEGNKISDKKTNFLEDDTIMEVNIPDELSPGKYTVKWTCMSIDGHKQTGEFTFSIK